MYIIQLVSTHHIKASGWTQQLPRCLVRAPSVFHIKKLWLLPWESLATNKITIYRIVILLSTDLQHR